MGDICVFASGIAVDSSPVGILLLSVRRRVNKQTIELFACVGKV